MANEQSTSKLENQRLNTAGPAMSPAPVLPDSQNKITDNDTNSLEKRSRGRPKKEEVNATSSSTADSTVKRSRGRPKQTESSSVPKVLEKRTRGRPKKEESKPITAEKRGPGRPKATSKDVFDGPTKADDETSDLNEKRGRGRPRKNPLVGKSKIAPKRVKSDNNSNGAPKPRGRPRKITTEKEEVEVSHPDSETKMSSNDTAIPAEISTAYEDQIENSAQSTNSIQVPNDVQNVSAEYKNDLNVDSQTNESDKKRGRPKKDDQTEQGLTKKVKA